MARYGISGRTVVITGSTGGLGSSLAAALRAKGARLGLLDLDGEAVAAQAAALGGPEAALGVRADVRDLAGLEAAMARIADHFGRIDVVVANAGLMTMAPMSAHDPAEFERVIDVNLVGVWRTLRAGLPHVARQQGYLLAISSMAAFVHSPLQTPYTATKAGVWAMCDSIRLEVRHLGVRVGTVHPTFFDTPMMDAVNADDAGLLLWGGNRRGGLWAMVDKETVVAGIVSGIERRAKLVVVPRYLGLIARAPGFARPVVDLIGFRDRTVARATDVADPRLTTHQPD